MSGQTALPVSLKEGQALAKQIKAVAYIQTSAKTGEGIEEAFKTALQAAVSPDSICSHCSLL